MRFPTDENVLVGLVRADDAGVYKISDDLALIQTVDFFTPVVDDPYLFGQIAAANALSDVYAMGGEPKTAMNLVGFPNGKMDIDILREVIRGGAEKISEAGAVLLGGHSVDDPELKYGLAVTGFIHPDRILTKKSLEHGDRLVLTKPLGTGIINTAVKAGLATGPVADEAGQLMAQLNKEAAQVMKKFSVRACTDITGFGLLGHLAEMVEGSGKSARVFSKQVAMLPQAQEYAAMGLVPAGAYRNREFRQSMIRLSPGLDRAVEDILFDPQTSGGLLMSVSKNEAKDLVDALRKAGAAQACMIGEVVSQDNEIITVE